MSCAVQDLPVQDEGTAVTVGVATSHSHPLTPPTTETDSSKSTGQEPTLAALVSSTDVEAHVVPSPEETLRLAAQAERAKDHALVCELLQSLVDRAPSNAAFRRYLSGALFSSGDPEGALRELEVAAALHAVIPDDGIPNDKALRKRAPERFAALQRQLKSNALRVGRWRAAYVLREHRKLAPEGIEYDAKRERVLVGSIDQRRVVSVDHDGAVTQLAGLAQGLLPVIGIRVDTSRDLLWAATADEVTGQSELVAIDLGEGSIRQRFSPPNESATGRRSDWHLLNDIAVASSGHLVVTDSEAGCIYELRPGEDRLRTILCDRQLDYPNGVALSASGRLAYVAYSGGVAVVDLELRAWSVLTTPAGVNVSGADGVYRVEDELILVQNNALLNRVAAVELAPDGYTALSERVLIANPPTLRMLTTAAIHDGEVWLLHFSPWNLPKEQWRAPQVLHFQLRPG